MTINRKEKEKRMTENVKTKLFVKIIAALIGLLALIGSVCFIGGSAEAKNIVKGDTTANVRVVQQRLYNLGYYTYKVDGIWGTRTKPPSRSSRRTRGLSPTVLWAQRPKRRWESR